MLRQLVSYPSRDSNQIPSDDLFSYPPKSSPIIMQCREAAVASTLPTRLQPPALISPSGTRNLNSGRVYSPFLSRKTAVGLIGIVVTRGI